MGKSQRTKGATYEREVCKAFSDALGSTFQRNIGQSRDGGNDVDIGPFVVECKRRKTLGTVYGWLRQAAAAVPAGQWFKGPGILPAVPRVPIVVAREDQGESLVVLRLKDFLPLVRPYFVLDENP